ncbi:MAG: esterase-like activity of phytase family protein [Acidobacteria bacterium]|nr:esterase-like activity of phytase family protein [Acidobacteriota bacterium]
MKKALILLALIAVAAAAPLAQAQITLLATGSLTESRAGSYADLSGLNYPLENGAPANLLGGLGSGLAWASGNTFLALPDRGPNAIEYDTLIDNTASYIPRFHTITLDLKANKGTGLPFTLTPKLKDTTLLYSLTPLVYGSGENLGVGSGVPVENTRFKSYFSGRSDNFDPSKNSGYAGDARLDPEGIRVSNDGLSVFISDEYGPYVYQFLRATGTRLRAFKLPEHLFVSNLQPIGNDEISGNTSGRTANKGMEGLAITPDGKTLVGIMQTALIQDALLGGDAKNLLRLVVIDIASGKVREHGYLLTTGSGVSEIVALNNHEFLVDERDGKGLGDGSKAKVKQIFKIDLAGAVDITNMDGTEAATHAVSKTLFLDLVAAFGANGITPDQVPAKIEGIALGDDVKVGNTKYHTLWVANDNDFLQDYSGAGTNPNKFFVFGFTDADLAGSKYVPQNFWSILGCLR